MYFKLYFWSLLALCVGDRPNFLLIIVDDLRTSLGCYDDENSWTPNIDRLARQSTVFSHAYAQQALCAPSRNSFLTSRRPDTLRLYDFYSYWRDTVGNFTTLPQHLKENGYITKSIGKVFHPGVSSNYNDDSPYSWTEEPFHPSTNKYKDASVCRSDENEPLARNLICPVDVSKTPEGTLPDIEILEEAKHFLKDRNESTTAPFFLAVGFEKPHIPLKYPKEYLNYHPPWKFHLPKPYEWPENVSSVAYNPWIDIRKRDDVRALNLMFPWEKIPERFARQIIQSYYSAVSYVDDLIGKLLDQLENISARDQTVVVLMSDHGWSLGEHAVWAKYSNFDVAVRVPLIISIPGITYPTYSTKKSCENITKSGYPTSNSNKNFRETWTRTEKIIHRHEIVELVDVFPTLAELAGFPIPLCSNERKTLNGNTDSRITCSEGVSLVPLLTTSRLRKPGKWKRAAFSQYPRPGIVPTLKPNSDEPRYKEIRAMGRTIRTRRYRYTVWLKFYPKSKLPDWSAVLAEELYDHVTCDGENSNLAYIEKYEVVKLRLRRLLRRGWRNALPRYLSLRDH